MSIRVAPSSRPVTAVYTDIIDDCRLSMLARMLLITFIRRGPGTTLESIAELHRQMRRDGFRGEGRDALRTGFRELITVGYARRERHQDGRGHWHTITTIYDTVHQVDQVPPPDPGRAPDDPDPGRSTHRPAPRPAPRFGRPDTARTGSRPTDDWKPGVGTTSADGANAQVTPTTASQSSVIQAVTTQLPKSPPPPPVVDEREQCEILAAALVDGTLRFRRRRPTRAQREQLIRRITAKFVGGWPWEELEIELREDIDTATSFTRVYLARLGALPDTYPGPNDRCPVPPAHATG